MSKDIRITKGLDIKMRGEAMRTMSPSPHAFLISLRPDDFYGLSPKLLVQQGQLVRPGTPVFGQKSMPELVCVSPVFGKIKEVVRGEKRKLIEVLIEPDPEVKSHKQAVELPDLNGISPEQLIQSLLSLGLWPFFKERPFGVLANPSRLPKAIFVSGFDSAPLAADLDFLVADEMVALQKGFDVLNAFGKKVHLSVRPGSVLKNIKGVDLTYVRGPHPAGNVGVQINKLSPINKGETVWTISLPHVLVLGRLFATGAYDFSHKVAICGSEVFAPSYCELIPGTKLDFMATRLVDKDQSRLIWGNALSGSTESLEHGALGYYDYQITAIPEGNYQEFLGWGMPRFHKFSASKTYFSWLFPGKQYKLDTNMNGCERAFVVTGQYEKVFPMDIFPVYLLKAILAKDIDKMEQLGIYEVLPEDMALCEFVCTSKIEVQQIVRDGIALMLSEMN